MKSAEMNPHALMKKASLVTQEALLKAINHYSDQLNRVDLKPAEISRIIHGLNEAQARLNKEVIGYDGTLAPRTEEDSITGMDTPLVRLNDSGLWEQL